MEQRYILRKTEKRFYLKKNVQACNGTTTNTQNGRFINFLNRLENKINDKRYNFLLGEKSKKISFEETLKNLLGYK